MRIDRDGSPMNQQREPDRDDLLSPPTVGRRRRRPASRPHRHVARLLGRARPTSSSSASSASASPTALRPRRPRSRPRARGASSASETSGRPRRSASSASRPRVRGCRRASPAARWKPRCAPPRRPRSVRTLRSSPPGPQEKRRRRGRPAADRARSVVRPPAPPTPAVSGRGSVRHHGPSRFGCNVRGGRDNGGSRYAPSCYRHRRATARHSLGRPAGRADLAPADLRRRAVARRRRRRQRGQRGEEQVLPALGTEHRRLTAVGAEEVLRCRPDRSPARCPGRTPPGRRCGRRRREVGTRWPRRAGGGTRACGIVELP